MAVPFNLPDDEESSSSSSENVQPVETTTNTPSRPIENNNNSHSPQVPQIDNEALVQAFYEALCRCSQGQHFAASSLPVSPSSYEHFWFPTPSTSVASSPRSSIRINNNEHRRGDSLGSRSQFSDDDVDLFHWDVCSNDQQPNLNNQKKPKNKITNFVISALQFVINTLK